MLKNVTITVEEEALRWARRQAADQGTVSKLVGRILEREMRGSDSYWQAYEHWKELKPVPGVDASRRWGREELHERGR